MEFAFYYNSGDKTDQLNTYLADGWKVKMMSSVGSAEYNNGWVLVILYKD